MYKLGKELSDLCDRTLEQIHHSLVEGVEYVLLSEEEIANDEDGMVLYEMPQFTNLDKYDTYAEYGIVSITKKDDDTVFVLGNGADYLEEFLIEKK